MFRPVPHPMHDMDYRLHILKDLLRAARPCVVEVIDTWQRLADDAGEDAVFATDASRTIKRLHDLVSRIDEETSRA